MPKKKEFWTVACIEDAIQSAPYIVGCVFNSEEAVCRFAEEEYPDTDYMVFKAVAKYEYPRKQVIQAKRIPL